jgi:hypothetical protein
MTDRRGFLGALAAAAGLGFVARTQAMVTHVEGWVSKDGGPPRATHNAIYRERMFLSDDGTIPQTIYMSRIEPLTLDL